MILRTAANASRCQHEWIAPLRQLPLLKILTAPSGVWSVLPKQRAPREVDENLPNPDMEMLLRMLPNLRFIFKESERYEPPRAIIIWQEPEEVEINLKRLSPAARVVEAGRVDSKRWRIVTGIGAADLKHRIWRIIEAECAADGLPSSSNLSAFHVPLGF